jgi:hypothetical protein
VAATTKTYATTITVVFAPEDREPNDFLKKDLEEAVRHVVKRYWYKIDQLRVDAHVKRE